MNRNDLNNQNASLSLFGLDDKINFLTKLYKLKKLPRTLMVSGKKGIGKSTLIKHFMNYIFDQDNYDFNNKTINIEGSFYKQFLNNTFPNIIYKSGDSFKNLKIDDIRNLKKLILKTSILQKERFIIFDDVELLNSNSLNAILKIIEEPTSNNYFIMINNETKPLIETLHSRCIELKVTLSDDKRLQIIDSLIKINNLEVFIDYKIQGLTPGNFMSFNKICAENKIDFNGGFLENLTILINLYKKSKNINLINLALFLTDYYFYNLKNKNTKNIEKIIQDKNFVIRNINNFITYNINQNSLINAVNNKLSNE